MSKIGKKPIFLPPSVEMNINEKEVKVKGQKGEVSLKLPSQIKVELIKKDDKTQVLVKRVTEAKMAKALHGLYRSLIDNMILGVERGYERKLELHGIGYQATLVNAEDGRQKLNLSLGFSHPMEVVAKEGITFSATKHQIVVFGIDKQLVGQVAASIRALRPPEPYKGKGIRFAGEKVKKKPGKAVAKTTGM